MASTRTARESRRFRDGVRSTQDLKPENVLLKRARAPRPVALRDRTNGTVSSDKPLSAKIEELSQDLTPVSYTHLTLPTKRIV